MRSRLWLLLPMATRRRWAFWTGTRAGDTIRVWIVDVGQTRLYIEGATHAIAGVDLERELKHIVGSIRSE